MPRRPAPPGTYGEIKVRQIGRVWEADGRIRIADGSTPRVRRRAATKTAARDALKEAFAQLADEATSSEIKPETRFAAVADLWFAEFELDHRQAGRSPGTPRQFKSWMNGWIKPRLGQLMCVEVTAGPCDRLIRKVRDARSYDAAKSVRAVLKLICDYAVRHGAMKHNPVASAKRLTRGGRAAVKSLDAGQRADMLRQLETFAKAKQQDSKGRPLGKRGTIWLQIPDVFRGQLSTAARLGEILACAGDDVLDRKLRLGHHLVREIGTGTVRMPGRKFGEKAITLDLPEWSMPMWRRLKLASGGGPLFPSFHGGWLAPDTMDGRMQEALKAIGYGWVTAHVMRKTVARVLQEAGLSAGQIALQLGNTEKVVKDHYLGDGVINEDVVFALEAMEGVK